MKKLASIILISVFALVGCGKKEKPQEKPQKVVKKTYPKNSLQGKWFVKGLEGETCVKSTSKCTTAYMVPAVHIVEGGGQCLVWPQGWVKFSKVQEGNRKYNRYQWVKKSIYICSSSSTYSFPQYISSFYKLKKKGNVTTIVSGFFQDINYVLKDGKLQLSFQRKIDKEHKEVVTYYLTR